MDLMCRRRLFYGSVDFNKRRLSGWSNLIAGAFPLDGDRRESQRVKAREGCSELMLTWGWRGLHSQECERPLEAERPPSDGLRGTGTSVLLPWKAELCQQVEWAWEWFSPGASRQAGLTRWLQLCGTLSRKQSRLQNCEIIMSVLS